MDRTNRSVLTAIGAGAIVLLAPPTMGDERDARSEDQVLRGPDVEDRDVPGAASTFGETEMRPAQGRERPIPHRVFIEVLQELASPEAPADVRATPEQVEQAREIQQAFLAERRAYLREHADELRELREVVRTAREARDRVDSGRPPTAEQIDAARRLRELQGSGANPEDAHARIWELLTEPQQEYMRARFDEVRARDGMRARTGDAPMGAMTDRAVPGEAYADLTLEERWGRLGERVAQLPEAQQERILRRLEGYLGRLERTDDREEPPSMREVDVPAGASR